MTVHILLCDAVHDGEVCQDEYGGDPDVPSVAALREKASTEAGWHPAADGRDLCPDCWAEGHR